MAFQLSPGVLVVEKDLTSIVPAVATSTGAFAGPFVWGPVLDPTLITSENQLVSRFGKPADGNASSFFTAANFLSYTNSLQLVRVATNNARNAVVTKSSSVTGATITNGGTLYSGTITTTVSAPQITGGVRAVLTAIISGGVVTGFTVVNAGSGYTSAPTITVTGTAGSGFVGTGTISLSGSLVNNESSYLDSSWSVYGEFMAKYPGALGNSISVSMADSGTFSTWYFKSAFDSAPDTSTFASNGNCANDELHVVVVDVEGQWTGVRGQILEKFAYVSKASDARKSDGTNNYYRDVINNSSKYIWWSNHPASGINWGTSAKNTTGTLKTFTALGLAEAINTTAGGVSLVGGVDDLSPTDAQIEAGFGIFTNAEAYDISLIPTGPVKATVAKWIVQNVVQSRLDCVAFISPLNITTGEIIDGVDAAEQMVAYRTDTSFNLDSSYAVLDSGYKYQYDRYNDVYRWVPLNGDTAGLCARTDYTNDPWWSPGGLNRGQVKNVVKLAFNPNKAERDVLYKSGINPVVSFPGQGTVLFGDKTLQSKPSAFDRINVRRLFIVLEKAIATAAKYQLFEFNDSFTRAQFRSMVEPFLRDVQGRRGITDFRVKCDESNNTGEVIDRNEFVADIFIKPARSINFITLNFIAARTGISFEEIGA